MIMAKIILLLLLAFSLTQVDARGEYAAPGTIRGRRCEFYKQCCEANSFKCMRNGSSKREPYFVPEQSKCDGIPQCPLKDDEQDCPKVCDGQPPSVNNARMLRTPPKTSPVGSAVRYQCTNGYTLAQGSSDCSICIEPGKWSDVPICVKICREEDAEFDNGFIVGTRPFTAGSLALLECNAGFISAVCNGSNALVCQEDGSWKGHAGCKPKSHLTCGDGPCTLPVESGGASWRLCDGTLPGICHPSKGRLEMAIDGFWAGVSSRDWTTSGISHNVQVACRTLGFSYGVQAGQIHEDERFTTSLKGVWLDDLTCTGLESNLLECTYDPLGQSSVSFTEYIAISCGNPCNEISIIPPYRLDS